MPESQSARTPQTETSHANTRGEQLVSPEGFAAYLAIGRRTFQTWRAVGKLPPPDLSLGKVIRWRWTTIDTWLEAKRRSNRP